jgi:hypothetical protein
MRSDDELRAEMSTWLETIRRADTADPTSWPEFSAHLAEMERENLQLRDREYMLDTATKLVTDTLYERQGLRHPRKWYRERLGRMLLQYPQPTLLIMTLGIMFDNFDDPTDMIEEVARMADLATEQWPTQ